MCQIYLELKNEIFTIKIERDRLYVHYKLYPRRSWSYTVMAEMFGPHCIQPLYTAVHIGIIR